MLQSIHSPHKDEDLKEASKRFLLRWRYDYKDKASIYGMWSNPGNIEANGAWKHNHEGVISASIEGKDIDSRKIVRLAECPGYDFVNFEWIAMAKIGNPFNIRGAITPPTRLMGLAIVTRDKIIEVFPNGAVVPKIRPEGHKLLKLATFGK